jgi:hypothetical protein
MWKKFVWRRTVGRIAICSNGLPAWSGHGKNSAKTRPCQRTRPIIFHKWERVAELQDLLRATGNTMDREAISHALMHFFCSLRDPHKINLLTLQLYSSCCLICAKVAQCRFVLVNFQLFSFKRILKMKTSMLGTLQIYVNNSENPNFMHKFKLPCISFWKTFRASWFFKNTNFQL